VIVTNSYRSEFSVTNPRKAKHNDSVSAPPQPRTHCLMSPSASPFTPAAPSSSAAPAAANPADSADSSFPLYRLRHAARLSHSPLYLFSHLLPLLQHLPPILPRLIPCPLLCISVQLPAATPRASSKRASDFSIRSLICFFDAAALQSHELGVRFVETAPEVLLPALEESGGFGEGMLL
jgi:hypothetical protein